MLRSPPAVRARNSSSTLEQGRIMGLIGKNGAGKSTLLKSLLHLVSPDAGTITLLGRPFPEGMKKYADWAA